MGGGLSLRAYLTVFDLEYVFCFIANHNVYVSFIFLGSFPLISYKENVHRQKEGGDIPTSLGPGTWFCTYYTCWMCLGEGRAASSLYTHLYGPWTRLMHSHTGMPDQALSGPWTHQGATNYGNKNAKNKKICKSIISILIKVT